LLAQNSVAKTMVGTEPDPPEIPKMGNIHAQRDDLRVVR